MADQGSGAMTERGIAEIAEVLRTYQVHDLVQRPDYEAMARAVVERVVPPCGTCGGVPPCSGLPCVCGGANTIYAEQVGLREELFDRDARLARLVEALKDLLVFAEDAQRYALDRDAGAGKETTNG